MRAHHASFGSESILWYAKRIAPGSVGHETRCRKARGGVVDHQHAAARRVVVLGADGARGAEIVAGAVDGVEEPGVRLERVQLAEVDFQGGGRARVDHDRLAAASGARSGDRDDRAVARAVEQDLALVVGAEAVPGARLEEILEVPDGLRACGIELVLPAVAEVPERRVAE